MRHSLQTPQVGIKNLTTTIRHTIAIIMGKLTTFYVKEENPTVYVSETKNIGWDPKEGMRIKEGNDRTGAAPKRNPDGTPSRQSQKEENRATKNETKTANNLGEPTRRTYNEGSPIREPNAIYSCKESGGTACK